MVTVDSVIAPWFIIAIHYVLMFSSVIGLEMSCWILAVVAAAATIFHILLFSTAILFLFCSSHEITHLPSSFSFFFFIDIGNRHEMTRKWHKKDQKWPDFNQFQSKTWKRHEKDTKKTLGDLETTNFWLISMNFGINYEKDTKKTQKGHKKGSNLD